MTLDIYKAFTESPPELDFVLPSLLRGSVGALISPGGVGKSMWALQLAMQVAGGADLLGFGVMETGPVVYLPAEDPEELLLHRLHSMGSYLTEQQMQNVSDNLCVQSLVGYSPNILDVRWKKTLESIAYGNRLLIIDTLRRFHHEDENSSSAMAQVLAQLENIAILQYSLPSDKNFFDHDTKLNWLYYPNKNLITSGYSIPLNILKTCLPDNMVVVNPHIFSDSSSTLKPLWSLECINSARLSSFQCAISIL
jgi:hypothetical protein